MYQLIAKVAVTHLFALTFMSVRGFFVKPSLHWTKWYPVFGTAVTGEPQAP